MPEVTLTGLDGANPLGFLAALGTLAVAERMLGPDVPRVGWTNDIVPRPLVRSGAKREELVATVLADRDRWNGSAALDLPSGDVKLDADRLRAWLEDCERAAQHDDGRALGLVTALVADGSLARDGKAKPTHLHFTAGKQQFLQMARTLRDGLTAEHVEEALFGPWRYASTLPSFKWDVADDRTYALSAVNPASETKRTVPGAEWLALLGLSFLPVTRGPRGTVTTGCSGRWKEGGAFSWPVWEGLIPPDVVRTLVGIPDLVQDPPPPTLVHRGVSRVFRSAITRSDQGGYGSFRPPRNLLDRMAAP